MHQGALIIVPFLFSHGTKVLTFFNSLSSPNIQDLDGSDNKIIILEALLKFRNKDRSYENYKAL